MNHRLIGAVSGRREVRYIMYGREATATASSNQRERELTVGRVFEKSRLAL